MPYRERTQEERDEWRAWLEGRPESVRRVAEHIVPWELYQIDGRATRYQVFCYTEEEDGSVSVQLLALHAHNPEGLSLERRVFGVDPDTLTLCEPPMEH